MKQVNPVKFKIPKAASSIQAGSSLKELLDLEAINCLKQNVTQVYPAFDSGKFRRLALDGIEPLGLMDRGCHLAKALRLCLPDNYSKAIKILLSTLTPPHSETSGLGLAVFFYHPHGCFVSSYGLDPANNGGRDPFEISMKAQHELTRRFTAEFSIRPFLIHEQKRTLAKLFTWTEDSDPHVRRLCSEGTRPRLPWAPRIPAFVSNPKPALPILEKLKDDSSLYVRRSVANHLGDIAKSHPELAFSICKRWMRNADSNRLWVIRHALRHPAKKGDKTALSLRAAAKN